MQFLQLPFFWLYDQLTVLESGQIVEEAEMSLLLRWGQCFVSVKGLPTRWYRLGVKAWAVASKLWGAPCQGLVR